MKRKAEGERGYHDPKLGKTPGTQYVRQMKGKKKKRLVEVKFLIRSKGISLSFSLSCLISYTLYPLTL